MALKAAIFDLDGTLIDSEPFAYSLYNALIEPYGHTLPEERYALEYSGHTLDVNLVHIIEQYDLPITVEDGFGFFVEHGANKGQAGVPLKPGVARLLAWLTSHNVAMALGSSSGEERAFGYLDPLGVGFYFPVAAYGPEVEHGKPAPDIFLLAAERLGVTPDECVVFEDSEAGVLAGVAAGMRTFCTPDMAPVSEEARAQAYANLTRIDQAIPLLEELLG